MTNRETLNNSTSLYSSTSAPKGTVVQLESDDPWEEFDPLNPGPKDPTRRVAVTIEPLSNLRQIAQRLGLPYFKILRAANKGIFPTYRLYNTRRLARLSEVVAAIDASRQGGTQ